MFDPKCHDLAKVFLRDDPDFYNLPIDIFERCNNRLAQQIQDTIEDFLADSYSYVYFPEEN